MISSLEKNPTFPHQNTSQRSEYLLWSIDSLPQRSAFGPDQFVPRHWSFGDLQRVTCKLVLFLRFSWGEAVPAESWKAFHSNDNVETCKVSHWQLNLSSVNKLLRTCWTLLYLQRRSSSSLFVQGLCLRQIRMRVMDPLRAGPQFAEACCPVHSRFSNAKTFKAGKIHQFHPWIMSQGLPKNARSQAPDLAEAPWQHEIPPRFCIFFAIEIRTRRASTILRPDLNLDRH